MIPPGAQRNPWGWLDTDWSRTGAGANDTRWVTVLLLQGRAVSVRSPSVLVEPHAGCVTLGKLLKVSEPQFARLHCGYDGTHWVALSE